METTLVKSQTKQLKKDVHLHGDLHRMYVTVRHDDECGNGYNTFSITGEIHEIRNGRKAGHVVSGCIHDEIALHFPELAHLIKWQLFGTDGPMHYIENARYWAGHLGYKDGEPNSPPNWDHFKSTAAWGAAPEYDTDIGRIREMDDDDLQRWLRNRLDDIMAKFKEDIQALGFTY